MEVTLSAESIAVFSVCVVILLALVGGFVAQVRYTSRLATREELHATRDELRGDMTSMREEFRRDMASMREEFRRDMASMREEFRRDIEIMRQEMHAIEERQRQEMRVMRDELLTAIHDSETRIIKALVNHRHIEPDGAPIFVEPV